MYLKRLYPDDVSEELKAIRAEPDSAERAARLEAATRKVGSVRILRLSKRWHVTPRLVERGASEGWLSMVDGHVVLKGESGPVKFKIVAAPNQKAGQHYYHCEHVEG